VDQLIKAHILSNLVQEQFLFRLNACLEHFVCSCERVYFFFVVVLDGLIKTLAV